MLFISSTVKSQSSSLYSYSLKEYNLDGDFEDVGKFEVTNSDGLEISEFVLSTDDDYQLVLSIINTSYLYEGFFVLEIPDYVMLDSYEYVFEYKDVAGDSNKELLIWWTGYDGHGGSEGYNLEVKGVTIIDLIDYKAILQINFYYNYLAYTNYEDEEYQEEECNYSIELNITTKNVVKLSNYKESTSSAVDCDIPSYQKGIYYFNSNSKKYKK